MKKEKHFIFKLILLVGIVIVNIYPMSCATGVAPSVPITQPTTVTVNVADYIKALQCIQNSSSATQADKDLASAKASKLSVYPSPTINEDITQHDNFKTMANKNNCPNAF